jgi:hypothetical protein
VMAQAIAAYPASVRMQEEFWCRGTGHSRASFYRCKKVYLKQRHNDGPG